MMENRVVKLAEKLAAWLERCRKPVFGQDENGAVSDVVRLSTRCAPFEEIAFFKYHSTKPRRPCFFIQSRTGEQAELGAAQAPALLY